MEKSSLNAAMTRTIAASRTAANVAIPARRAVSPSLAERASRWNKERIPAKHEYKLRQSAKRSAKLPIWDMRDNPGIFFQRNRRFRKSIKGPEVPAIQNFERCGVVLGL